MKEIDLEVRNFVDVFGQDALMSLLKSASNELKNESDILTIIANSGVHPLHKLHMRGEVFIASTGNLNFCSVDSAEAELKEILMKVACKLQSKSWKKVYIVPFGPSVLSMLIKSLVYKILYIETVDILHAGNGVHYDIAINLRELAIQADETRKAD